MRKVGDILREAAKLVEEEKQEYSCTAIAFVVRWDYDAIKFVTAAYAEMLGLDRIDAVDFTEEEDEIEQQTRFIPSVEARNHRIVALCMAAVLADEAGLRTAWIGLDPSTQPTSTALRLEHA